MTAEQIIKTALDGLFFTINMQSHKVMCKRVPKDYIPSHKPKVALENRQATIANSIKWTQEDDDLLLELRAKGYKWRRIAKHFNLAPTTVNNHYQDICRRRGISPVVVPQKIFPDEVEARVVQLKNSGLMLKEVAEVTGLSRNQVVHLWVRWRDRMKREGKVAA